MKTTYLFLLLLLFIGATSVFAQNFCFENQGLKTNEIICFTLTNNTLKSGVWKKQSDDASNNGTENYPFYGTKAGDKLIITFTGKIPYTLPMNTQSVVWTLKSKRLKIPMSGKNYETRKFENYTVDFNRK